RIDALREQCEQRSQIHRAEPQQRRNQQQRDVKRRPPIEEGRQRSHGVSVAVNGTASARAHSSRTRAPTRNSPLLLVSGTAAAKRAPLSSRTCQRLIAPWYCTSATSPTQLIVSPFGVAASARNRMFSARTANGSARPLRRCANSPVTTLALPTKRATNAVV